MNGKYILDTNAIIALLNGESLVLQKIVNNASWVGISVISELEFLSFSKLTSKDSQLFSIFKKKVSACPILEDDAPFINAVVDIRKEKKVKLPDAIILATAKLNDAELITNDKRLQGLEGINVKTF